jgi:hypothetical protein
MALSDAGAGAAVARFDFTSGEARGTHLTLYVNCLVHRGEARLETLPLATMASVAVSFERDMRRLGWGVALLVIALIVYAISGPLAELASAAGGEVAGGTNGVAGALHALFRFLEAIARLLPVPAVLLAIAGVASAAFGWLGWTTLRLAFAGGERSYPVRGRNAALLDFAESVSEKVMVLGR